MVMKSAVFAAVTWACMSLYAQPAIAATLIVSDGKLVGANGVNVGGHFYNVTFVEGTCSVLFDGCDSPSDFDFTTSSDAGAAAAALLNQVFLDGAAGNFDSQPDLVFGCGDPNICTTYIPYGIIGGGAIAAGYVNNTSPGFVEGDSSGGDGNVRFAEDTNQDRYGNYARFSAVPEPASWAMMLLGFGAIGIAMRRTPRHASGAIANR